MLVGDICGIELYATREHVKYQIASEVILWQDHVYTHTSRLKDGWDSMGHFFDPKPY